MATARAARPAEAGRAKSSPRPALRCEEHRGPLPRKWEGMTNPERRRPHLMKHFGVRRALLLVALLLALPNSPLLARGGQGAPAMEELPRTLAALDGALFDSFNRCDLEKFASFFIDDVEFYHDKGGLTLSRRSLVESVKNNICGKVRREVVAGSVEAHPIPGYGAVQMGVHRFYEVGAKQGSGPVGVAKFIHLWQHKDGAWKITRVISYDHGPAPR